MIIKQNIQEHQIKESVRMNEIRCPGTNSKGYPCNHRLGDGDELTASEIASKDGGWFVTQCPKCKSKVRIYRTGIPKVEKYNGVI